MEGGAKEGRLVEVESAPELLVGASSGRPFDPLGQDTRKAIEVLADKNLAQLFFTIQCWPTASNKWYPTKETTLCIKDSPRLGPFRR